MYVTMIGLATTHRSYQDKETGATVMMQNCVVDDQAFAIKMPDETCIGKMQPVVVSGDLSFYNRQVFLRRGKVRLATDRDVDLLSDPSVDVED